MADEIYIDTTGSITDARSRLEIGRADITVPWRPDLSGEWLRPGSDAAIDELEREIDGLEAAREKFEREIDGLEAAREKFEEFRDEIQRIFDEEDLPDGISKIIDAALDMAP